MALVGVASDDDVAVAQRLAEKTAKLRIFTDRHGRFEHSLQDISGEVLVVSQFTLLGDVRRGRRPSFDGAATSASAEPLVEAYASALRDLDLRVSTGRFGATMQVSLVNDGPVTIILDSNDLSRSRRG